MKFQEIKDAQLFLAEINMANQIKNVTSKDFEPTQEMIELFFKSRKSLVPKVKSFRRSQSSKEQWRSGRDKYMSGIKRFHRSTKGKQFHRQLGRFLSTRVNQQGYTRESLDNSTLIQEMSETLKALSSLKTHLLIEYSYFMTMEEQAEYEIFTEDLLPTLQRIESCLMQCTDSISEDDLELLLSSIHPEDLVKSLAEVFNRPLIDTIAEFNSDMEKGTSMSIIISNLRQVKA